MTLLRYLIAAPIAAYVWILYLLVGREHRSIHKPLRDHKDDQ